MARESSTEHETKHQEHEGHEVSHSTREAKWINATGEREDHHGQTLATRSHEVIRHWAEQRGGQPSTVPGTWHGDHPGVLRFDFPGYGGQKLEHISWDDWFGAFDDRHLIFLFQEHKSDGQQSNFFHLDDPNR